MSNAVLSPARARATRAPSRSAAAIRSAEAEGSAGTLALTESVTLGRAGDSAHRRAACGIPDRSSLAAVATLDRLAPLELALRLLLGALARVLLVPGRALLLLRPQHRHHLLACL